MTDAKPKRFRFSLITLLVAVNVAGALCIWFPAAAEAAARAPRESAESGSTLSTVLLILLVGVIPYLAYSTALIWGTGRLMSVEDRTPRTAFRLAVLQFVIPLPVAVLLSLALAFIGFNVLPSFLPETWFVYVLLLSWSTVVLVYWWLCVTFTQNVYSIGFLHATLFNLMLVVVHAFVAYLFGAGRMFTLIL